MIERVFYASAGGANLIDSHRWWKSGTHNPNEVSITYSGQVEQFCRDIGARALFVSMHPDGATLEEDDIRIEHRPKRARHGLGFHLGEARYAWSMLRRARAFGADVAILDSGTTHFFMMALFPLFGIPVVPVLYNCLWAKGFRPRSRSQRVLQWLDAMFWRRVPLFSVAISPEAERQVVELTGPDHRPIFQTHAQFLPEYFAPIAPPPPHDASPFRMLFIGRVDVIKGVLDIPLMARRVEEAAPGRVHWTICGKGPALEELRRMVESMGLGGVIDVRGWTSLEDLRAIYGQIHATIIPTRSSFAEGLAMTAVEAILAGRPIVTNPIVPALELLRPAAVEARSNDAESHADAVLKMATDAALYDRLCAATLALRSPFYDREQGLVAVLKRGFAQT